MHNQQIELTFSNSGFRLHSLEVLNWGTFTSRIWKLQCEGSTSLLTGSNGSGKSTLVDALLTLLVPLQKRHYNQASGTQSKRERSELSYVLGAYGKIREEDEISRTRYLRTRQDYSVILGRFVDELTKATVTLVQLFWFERDELQKLFLVSSLALDIENNFSKFSAAKDLKKECRQLADTEIFSRFSEYNSKFRKLLGINSETALDLFNQTVSIKAIGDLNGFIRSHMLDKIDLQEKIEDLRKNFNNLDQSYKAILKARRQLELLTPLINQSKEYGKLCDDAELIDNKISTIPFYFARQKLTLLDAEKIDLDQQIERNTLECAEAMRILEELRRQEMDQQIAIQQDSTAVRLLNLERDIQHQQELLASRVKRSEEYARLSTAIGITSAPQQEEEFNRRFNEFITDTAEQEQLLLETVPQRDAAVISHNELERQRAADQQELDSLHSRRSQIPEKNLRLRDQIAISLNLSSEELPFAGELIRVKPHEQPWEGAIERVLRNFGLRILVPEQHYSGFNQYVSRTNLKGKIVYQKIPLKVDTYLSSNLDSDSLSRKVEVKSGTIFTAWLQRELSESYSYICTNDLVRFQREDKALTESGLVKGGKIHEKDDRNSITDKRYYILGWENKEKINALAFEIRKIESAIKASAQAIESLRLKQEQLQKSVGILKRLADFSSFTEIDTFSLKVKISDLQRSIRELETASEGLKQLRIGLEKIREEIKAADTKKDLLQQLKGRLEDKRQNNNRHQQQCRQTLATALPEVEGVIAETSLIISEEISSSQMTLETVSGTEKSYRSSVEKDRAALSNLIQQAREELIKKMTVFKKEFPEETQETDASIQALNEFMLIYTRIEEQDLPRHEKRFKELLNDNIIRDIAHFKSSLERYEEDITARITGLNSSLKNIKYTPATFIRMNAHPTTDIEIRDFKKMLRDCLPDVGSLADGNINQLCFEKIQSVIKKLEEEERWSAKVTDVRNWLMFSASELYESDLSEKAHYSDSSGLSGGQKAKLAYTILASAIAYQFGLYGMESRNRSFRFVVVDEAFSKSDEANSRYAMDLFKTLGLQLLVVTPLDKIHLVEPYISACHFVDNNDTQSYSRIVNFTMEQYHIQKQQFSNSEYQISQDLKE